MKHNKKQNVIIILLGIITFLLLFLIGIILLGNYKTNDNNINNMDINEKISYSYWMKHILNSDIQTITLTKNYINSGKIEKNEVDLTKQDLEDIFSQLNNYDLELVNITGLGIAENELLISYIYDSKTYTLLFHDKYIVTDSINKDEKLINLLYNSKYSNNTDNNGNGEIFRFSNLYKASIYDNYFLN